MRILIVGTIQGDNGYEEEYLIKNIEKYLISQGHTVDNFMLPFTRDMLALPDQIVAYQMVDTSSAEMLITIGFPACTVKHCNKIIYLLETFPMLHEYWESEYGVLPNAQYSRIYETINEIEGKVLKEAKKIVCNSEILRNDLNKRYAIESTVQFYPNVFEKFDDYYIKDERYYICETSLLPYQRIELLLDTIKLLTVGKWYLYIPKTNPVYLETLEKQIEARQITDKITLCKGIISDNAIRNATACFATDYEVRKIPGVIIRCASLGTPVITCEDSGAITEFVSLNNCGIIEKSDVNILAKRFHQLKVIKKSKNAKKSGDLESFMRGLTTL